MNFGLKTGSFICQFKQDNKGSDGSLSKQNLHNTYIYLIN